MVAYRGGLADAATTGRANDQRKTVPTDPLSLNVITRSGTECTRAAHVKDRE